LLILLILGVGHARIQSSNLVPLAIEGLHKKGYRPKELLVGKSNL